MKPGAKAISACGWAKRVGNDGLRGKRELQDAKARSPRVNLRILVYENLLVLGADLSSEGRCAKRSD